MCLVDSCLRVSLFLLIEYSPVYIMTSTQINWLKELFRNPTSIWNIIPLHILSKLGGFNVCTDKIPVKMFAFHRQALLSRSLIYKHNFSPHNYIIWNNKAMLYVIYVNIVLVDQLFNSNGLELRVFVQIKYPGNTWRLCRSL